MRDKIEEMGENRYLGNMKDERGERTSNLEVVLFRI